MFNPKQSEKSIPSLMDLPSNRSQSIYKSYKPNYQHSHKCDMSNRTTSPSHGYFKASRIQNHGLKWKKNYQFRGNRRSTKHPYKKNNVVNKKLSKSAEDVEEEERKKKLNDTAKKLLNKIKTWNAENDVEEVTKPKENCQQFKVNQLSSECNVVVPSEDKSDSKKRIAHSKKAKLVKNRSAKILRQVVKTTPKYDVNKASVKDFQSRIQHKLIEEIMQMPKENLQSVLNDPKINPIMGLKMSRLVQENRPLITQKLRAIAESKMESLGFTSSPQLLVDIDKLIDPVIETDLSALPYELIKQMENLFQVQFDYSQNSDSEVVFDSSGGPQQSELLDNLQNNTFKEDFSLYECSTDEDEEVDTNHCTFFGDFVMPSMQDTQTTDEISGRGDKSGDAENFTSETTVTTSVRGQAESVTTSLAEEPIATASPSPVRVFATACCQTDSKHFAISSTQTFQEDALLYGVPLPIESKCGSRSSLLEEVDAIQNLTNKLNERRLKIFLELFRMNPEGDFASDERTKRNLTETLSNGSICMIDAFQEFFRARSNKNQKNLHFKPNQSNFKASKKWVNRNKSKKGENR